ncbi:uncharacterized protein PHA67_003715 isoform 1-T2 [Liasis olivaceus]
MERVLPRALLLLFLVGRMARESGGETCHLGPYGVPLPDDPVQCPGRFDGSGESPLDAAESSPEGPRQARAGPPLALISGFSAEEGSPPYTGPKGAGIFLVEGELCHKWVHGQASPIESFLCPTQDDYQEDTFCCGTCTASYCCSSLEDRLEQASCPKAEDQWAGESTGPSVGKLGSFGILELVLLAIGVVCVCIGIFYILRCVEDRLIAYIEQRAANEQPRVVHEISADAAVDHPVPRRAFRAAPDPPSLLVEESQRTSQLPPAGASPPGGSGSPMHEMTVFPRCLPEGNLELPSEEKVTAL